MLQDLADDAWILKPELAPALDAMQAAGLRFDALVTPRHLPHLARFLARRPDLKVVIDHGAKPDIAAGALADWSADYARHRPRHRRGLQALRARHRGGRRLDDRAAETVTSTCCWRRSGRRG